MIAAGVWRPLWAPTMGSTVRLSSCSKHQAARARQRGISRFGKIPDQKLAHETSPDSLKEFIARINRIRRENPALQSDWSLRFHDIDNEQIICYTKQTEDLGNVIAVVVNLDPHHVQSGWVKTRPRGARFDAGESYQAHDLVDRRAVSLAGGKKLRRAQSADRAGAYFSTAPAHAARAGLRLLHVMTMKREKTSTAGTSLPATIRSGTKTR